eukprot:scaffold7272_cov124-Skeletonema_dohrnii-CCMP3373.AAC.3
MRWPQENSNRAKGVTQNEHTYLERSDSIWNCVNDRKWLTFDVNEMLNLTGEMKRPNGLMQPATWSKYMDASGRHKGRRLITRTGIGGNTACINSRKGRIRLST